MNFSGAIINFVRQSPPPISLTNLVSSRGKPINQRFFSIRPTLRYKCSSSASSQWYGSSNSGRELPNIGHLTVFPGNHNQYFSSSSKIGASGKNQSSSLMNIQQVQQQAETETASQTSSDRLMILDDHKSPIKVCISSVSNDSNPELNNNSIVLIKKRNRADGANGRLNGNQRVNRGRTDNDLADNPKENPKENPKQYKHPGQVKQKKFAMAAKQLNKPMTSSQSYSSVCLKNINNFDAIEMIEPSSSCSSV